MHEMLKRLGLGNGLGYGFVILTLILTLALTLALALTPTLARSVYKPARACGLSSRDAALATFLASG